MFKKVALAIFFLINLVTVLMISTRPKFVDASIQTPTATPINYQELNILQGLISDEGCTLPCWWSFNLGEDALTSVENTLLNFFEQKLIKRIYENHTEVGVYLNTGDTGIQEDETSGYSSVSFWTRNTDKLLVAASLASSSLGESYVDWSPYLPPNLLRVYGAPDEVTITYPLDGAPKAGYNLHILYFEKGIFINYLMVYLTYEGEIDESAGIPICNYLNDVSTFKMWIQVEELDAEDIGAVWDSVRSSRPYEYSLEDISTYDMESFTEALSEADTCIYTLPFDEWVRSE